jgi:hypothetical protein
MQTEPMAERMTPIINVKPVGRGGPVIYAAPRSSPSDFEARCASGPWRLAPLFSRKLRLRLSYQMQLAMFIRQNMPEKLFFAEVL